MIQRLVAILLLSLLFLGTNAAVSVPDQGMSITLEVALDDGNDEQGGGEAGLEAPELGIAPRSKSMPGGRNGLALVADSPLPVAPFLEGPQRPPRQA